MMIKNRVIICGGRGFADYELLCERCNHFLKNLYPSEIEIVSGGQMGADALGEYYAAERNYPKRVFIADWKMHGLAAGPIRNTEMAKYATHCIAFWDGTVEHSGTFDMIRKANIAKLKVKVVRVKKSDKSAPKGPYATGGNHD